jgi:excisionase family DNA binding protein
MTAIARSFEHQAQPPARPGGGQPWLMRQGIGDRGASKGLLRVEEAAEWLGLGRTTAWSLVYRGVLPSVTIGRSRRVPMAALQAFVDRLVEEAEGEYRG